MEETQDAGQVLETVPQAETAPAGAAETLEQKVARLEKEKSDIDGKNKQLYERLKKAETPVAPKMPDLTPTDALFLAKQDVALEDVDQVVRYAAFQGTSVQDAMKDDTLKAILRDRVEKRKTAEATQVNPAGRQAQRDTPQEILDIASRGQLPDSDAGIDQLASARIAQKKASRQR